MARIHGIISAYGGYLDLRTSSSNGSDASSRLNITSDGEVTINNSDSDSSVLNLKGGGVYRI